MSCLIFAAGSDASIGAIAGPVPSSARARGSTSLAASATPDDQHGVQRAVAFVARVVRAGPSSCGRGWPSAGSEVTDVKVRPRINRRLRVRVWPAALNRAPSVTAGRGAAGWPAREQR